MVVHGLKKANRTSAVGSQPADLSDLAVSAACLARPPSPGIEIARGAIDQPYDNKHEADDRSPRAHRVGYRGIAMHANIGSGLGPVAS